MISQLCRKLRESQYICFFQIGSEVVISYCLSHNLLTFLSSWLSTKLGKIRYIDTVFLRILLLPHCLYGLHGGRDFAFYFNGFRRLFSYGIQAANTKSENKGRG
jgi:hypothetical protein